MNTASSSAGNKRRQVIINRPFQWNFVAQFGALMALGCGLFGLFLYFYSSQTMTTAFVNSKLKVMSTADFLMPAIGLTALLVSSMITFFAALRLVIFSHRIAGPLYRLEKTAQGIREGNLNLNVRLRSKDQFQELAKSMDTMVDDLRSRFLEIKHQTDRLRQITEQVGRKTTDSGDLLKSLEDVQQKLEEQVRHFRV